jgi:hypothetical protein
MTRMNHGIHAAPPTSTPMATQRATSRALPAAHRAPAPCGTDAGGRQLVQVDRGQVGKQLVQLTESPGLERFLQAGVELLRRQPSYRVMLAQQLSGPLPVRVRGAQPRVTRHRARRRRRKYRSAAE